MPTLSYKEATEIVTAARLELESKIERAKEEARDDVNGLGARLNIHVQDSENRFTRVEERLSTVAEQGAHTSGTERIVLMLLAALVSALMGLALKSVGTKTVIQPQPTVTATVTASPAPLSYPTPVTTVTVRPVVARAARPGASPSPAPRAPRPTPTPTTAPTPGPIRGLFQRACHLINDPGPLCKGKQARPFHPPLLLLPLSMLRVGRGKAR